MLYCKFCGEKRFWHVCSPLLTIAQITLQKISELVSREVFLRKRPQNCFCSLLAASGPDMLSLTINRGSPLLSREAQSHAIKETQSRVALLRWTLSSSNFSYKSPALPVKQRYRLWCCWSDCSVLINSENLSSKHSDIAVLQ